MGREVSASAYAAHTASSCILRRWLATTRPDRALQCLCNRASSHPSCMRNACAGRYRAAIQPLAPQAHESGKPWERSLPTMQRRVRSRGASAAIATAPARRWPPQHPGPAPCPAPPPPAADATRGSGTPAAVPAAAAAAPAPAPAVVLAAALGLRRPRPVPAAADAANREWPPRHLAAPAAKHRRRGVKVGVGQASGLVEREFCGTAPQDGGTAGGVHETAQCSEVLKL